MPFFMDLVTANGAPLSRTREFNPIYTPKSLDNEPLRSRLEKVDREIDVSTLLARARESGFSIQFLVSSDLFGEYPLTEHEMQTVEQMFCRMSLHLADVWGALIGHVVVWFESNLFRVRATLLFDDGEEVVRFAVERGAVRVRDVYSRFESVVKAHYKNFDQILT